MVYSGVIQYEQLACRVRLRTSNPLDYGAKSINLETITYGKLINKDALSTTASAHAPGVVPPEK